jgi:hypothetical protein
MGVGNSPDNRCSTKMIGWRPALMLVFILLASLSLNVWLGLGVRGSGRSSAQRASRSGPAAGLIIRNLEVKDAEGKRVLLEFAGQPTVLYVYSPSCTWCRRNLSNIKRLASASRGEYRFVGLMIDKTDVAPGTSLDELGFPTFADLKAATIADLALNATPDTIVVSAEGSVLKNWVGAYKDETLHDIERYFSLTLPGLERAQ